MTLEENVLASFKLPVKYSSGYIFDASSQMMIEVRAWGHLQYGPNPEETQDKMGEMFAAAFNEKYQKHTP